MDNNSNNLQASRYQSQNRDRLAQGRQEIPNQNSILRNKQRQERNFTDEDEEDEYERRREEELKRQIKSKENEIQNLSKASDFLRSKLDQSITVAQKQQVPLTESRYASFGRQMPERDRSPYQGSRTNLKDEQLGAPPHIREHVANLQSDNASLMRRLNLVMQELERVQKEKEEIQLRLQHFSKEAMNLQRMINGEDNIDKVNRYMQEDLAYEKDRNLKVKVSLKDQEIYRNELLNELRKIEDNQDQQAHQSQNITGDLQQRLNQIQDLEKEIYYAQEKIKQLNNAIEQGKREEMTDFAEKSDLQRVINQHLYERNDLLEKLDNLTARYDECVRDISMDRAQMERHNRQHSKLVTAKIIFQELEFILKNKYKQGFEEMKIYCSFDTKCHNKLQQFAKVLDLLGKHKQQIFLKKWYQNCLKPLEVKEQSGQIAYHIARTTLLGKKFHQWRKKYDQRINQYDLKTKAIQNIWQIKIRDSQIEQKRAFDIWKGTMAKAQTQKLKVKKLIWGLYFKKLSLAMNAWANHSSNIDSQIRLNLLSQKFTQKQYLTILFNNFKTQTFEMKRKRLNVLFHSVKYWKDYINYRKFLMATNLQALHFQRSISNNILKSCFDALKQSKEEEKTFKVSHELNEIERPQISDLNQEVALTSENRNLKLSNKAAEILCKLAGKSVFVPFSKWKKITQDFREVPNTKIKGRIIKAYYDKIKMAFNKWKVVLNEKKVENNQMIVMEQQEMQKELTEDVVNLQKANKDKKEIRDQCSQRHLHKCVISKNKRLVAIAMGRWKDKINETNVKEGCADTVVKRLRCRMLRQAFDLYLKGVKYRKKLEIEEERCKYYRRTRNERLLNHIFNQWRIYKNNFMRSKHYWSRIYNKMDQSLQERGFKRWREGAKWSKEHELQAKENLIIEELGELNHEIGKITADEEVQKQQLKETKAQMTKQARRVLANRFANFYYVGQTRGFEKWKEFTKYEKHRESLMKKMVNHWRKNKFYFAKACFKNWMMQTDIQERKLQIKKEDVRISDTENAFNTQQKSYQANKAKLDSELTEIHRLQEMYNSRLQKSIRIIVDKVDKNDYMSQKRYILQQWRTYVKREKFFIKCIQNVIQKSLWTTGWKQIKAFSRKEERQEKVATVLTSFRQKFYKRTCANAFSIWKSGQFKTVLMAVEETNENTNQKVNNFEEKKALRKEVNAVKSAKVLTNQKLRNVLYGFRNITKFLKQQRVKTETCQDSIVLYQRKCALERWRQRKNATKLARFRVQKLKEKFKKLRLLLVFRALRHKFEATRDFMERMSNLANIHDHQALKMGYNGIISFARAKKYVHNKQKEVATKELFGLLNGLVMRRKIRYLNDLKYRALNKYKQSVLKAYTILHNLSNKTRVYFLRWKEETDNKNLEIEMHNEGPVREQIFEDRIELKNLIAKMREEGYSESDISEALKQGKMRQENLLLKGVRRFQHYNEELYTKPKMFDRWRLFVQVRKQFKYWMRFASNRSQYIKCDLSLAFDRWRKFDKNSKEALMKLSKADLDKRVVRNGAKLGTLADIIQDKENELRHMNDQRDELVENYIKGQKLALALWQNNLKRAKHRAFLKWVKNSAALKCEQADNGLRKNVELIAALKEKILQLERDNDEFSNENEELRQFSLDGYEIAKNVQALSSEREKLSVDLADKAQTIRKLLDENEKLNKKLKHAQDEAQSLIKSTSSKYTGSQGAGGGMAFQSPMMRSNAY